MNGVFREFTKKGDTTIANNYRPISFKVVFEYPFQVLLRLLYLLQTHRCYTLAGGIFMFLFPDFYGNLQFDFLCLKEE